MPEDFSIHFWGVRGSRPSPGPHFVRTGGNTSCVEMRVGGQSIAFDAGTGIINLGNHLLACGEQRPVLICLSHYHHDHIQGLPHFPLMHRSDNPIYITTPWNAYRERVWKMLMRASARTSLTDRPANQAQRHLILIEGGERIFWDSHVDTPFQIITDPEARPADEQIEIKTFQSNAHPSGGCIFYRVNYAGKSAVFVTDTEAYVGSDRALVEFTRDADLMIHDAQYTPEEYTNPLFSRQGWGHSTWQMAVEQARLANIPRVALFHHDPDHTDEFMDTMEADGQEVYPGMFVAREGTDIVL